MKEQIQETGVRKWYGDDFINLQDELMTALEAVVQDYGNCIISGATVTNNGDGTYTISDGIAFIKETGGANGRYCRIYAQTLASASFPVYFTQGMKDKATIAGYGRQYKDAATKNIIIEYYGLLSSVMPGHSNYVSLTSAGVTTRLRDAIQNSSYRFASDTEKTTWNNKLAAADFTGANILTNLLTALSASYRFTTDAEKATWNSMFPGASFTGANILTALLTALSASYRFCTDTEKATWNGKLASTKAAIETLLTGVITSHSHTVNGSDIVEDASNRLTTDAEKATWNGKVSFVIATQAETDAGTVDTDAVTPLKLKTIARLYVGAGTELLPSYTFNGDPNTGLWSQAADVIGVSLGGDEKYRFTAGNLHIAGDAIFSSTTTPSDRRLKAQIKPIKKALDKIMKLTGASFHLKKDTEKRRRLGLIAQDVQQVIPEVVKEIEMMDGKKRLTVDYQAIVPVLIEAIKEQQAQIQAMMIQINHMTEGSK